MQGARVERTVVGGRGVRLLAVVGPGDGVADVDRDAAGAEAVVDDPDARVAGDVGRVVGGGRAEPDLQFRARPVRGARRVVARRRWRWRRGGRRLGPGLRLGLLDRCRRRLGVVELADRGVTVRVRGRDQRRRTVSASSAAIRSREIRLIGNLLENDVRKTAILPWFRRTIRNPLCLRRPTYVPTCQDGPYRPTTLAEWTAGDRASVEDARVALRSELERGYFAVVSDREGHAEQVHELPLQAPLVILRRPIAGG